MLIAGEQTLLGAALRRRLCADGNVPVCDSRQLELTDAGQVDAWFAEHRPRRVFLVGGPSGGIDANRRRPAQLMRDNLLINANVIDAAYRYRVDKLLYVASSCCYPRDCDQPMQPGSLTTGPLEPTSDAYATAKLTGIKLCQAYRQQHGCRFVTGIAADAFGPADHFDERDSHVVAALIHKMHEAKTRGEAVVRLWGTGTPQRDFIFADDLADACIFVMQHYDSDAPINLTGQSPLSIRELAELIKRVTGFTGWLNFDASHPDGMPVKVLDGTALSELGWRPRVELSDAVTETYRWYLAHVAAWGSANRVAKAAWPMKSSRRSAVGSRQ